MVWCNEFNWLFFLISVKYVFFFVDNQDRRKYIYNKGITHAEISCYMLGVFANRIKLIFKFKLGIWSNPIKKIDFSIFDMFCFFNLFGYWFFGLVYEHPYY